MLDGGHEFNEMLEIIIRGMRDEEAVKHRLLEKLEYGKIGNFKQLRRHVGSEIVNHKGVSSSEPIEQISYTSAFQSTTRQQQRNSTNDHSRNIHKFRNLDKVPHLNWPKLHEILLHLHKDNRPYRIMQRPFKKGTFWGCSGDHDLQDCDPVVLKTIPVCNGSYPPTCKVRHVGKKCPFVGEDRWLDRKGNIYHSPGGSDNSSCNDGNGRNGQNDDRDGPNPGGGSNNHPGSSGSSPPNKSSSNPGGQSSGSGHQTGNPAPYRNNAASESHSHSCSHTHSQSQCRFLPKETCHNSS